jgi:dephospho-CoA kinase
MGTQTHILMDKHYIDVNMKQLKVGITGNLGSGKTTVSKLFEELDIPVFNSDKAAREAESDEEMKDKIKEILGDDIYVNGEIDRPRMREMVFKNAHILKQMNDLISPFIKVSFNEFCLKNKNSHIIMIESAILLELNATEGLDKLIVVTADEEIRIKRAMRRDGITREQVMDKIKAQFSDTDKVNKANYLIYNNGGDLLDSLNALRIQVKTIVEALLYRQTLDVLNGINNLIK